MSFAERAFTFPCGEEKLLGIVAEPHQPGPTGVLIVVGGPQYRAGSHRQFLLLSRSLALAGYAVMRFDYRGMGDSTGEQRNFEAVNDDIGAAIDAFRNNCPHIQKVVLWGLCDAASASLLYWNSTQDERITGLVLLNPWVRSEATLARTHIKHYYGQRLLQREFWSRLLTGKLGLGRALKGFFGSMQSARQENSGDGELTFQKKMVTGLKHFPEPVLLILSGNDYTAKEFLEAVQADQEWVAGLQKNSVTRTDIPGADHTFSTAESRIAVENATRQWLETRGGQ